MRPAPGRAVGTGVHEPVRRALLRARHIHDVRSVRKTVAVARSGHELHKQLLGLHPAGQDADLTDPNVWTKLDYPLQKSGVYNGQWQLGTGHGMWSNDEDGNLIYVFHNAEYENGRYGGRDAQVRRVHWSKEGMPILDMQAAEELNPDYADITMKIVVSGNKG